MLIRISAIAVALAVAPVVATPARAQTSVEDVSGWALFDNKGTCTAITNYEGETLVMVRYDFSDESVHFTVSNPAWQSVENHKKYPGARIVFSNGVSWSDVTGRGMKVDEISGLDFFIDGNSFLNAFAEASSVEMFLGDKRLDALSLSGTAAMVAKLRKCSISSYKRFPPDPFAGEKGKSAGSAATPAVLRSGSISHHDYPSEALRTGAQGSTVAAFSVGTDGRVTKCSVVTSSGSALLDDTTCKLIVRRFRYAPALSADGTPVTEAKVETFTWAIPQG